MPHSAVTPALAAELTAARDAAERFATRLLGAERGADTASAAVLVAIERCAAGTPPRDVRRFVLGVVWKKAMGVGRRRAPRPLDEAAATPASAPDPARLAEVREWLTFALAKLDPHQRALLHLHYEEGASYEEIAAVVGGSVGGVGRKLHDARRRLARELDRHGAGALVALLPAMRRDATSLTAATEAVAAAEAAAVGGQTLSAASVGAWVVGGGAAMWKILCGAALVAAAMWWFARPAEPGAFVAPRTVPAADASADPPATDSRPAPAIAAAPFSDHALPGDPALLRGLVVDEAGAAVAGAFVAAESVAAAATGGRRLESAEHFTVTAADGAFALRGPEGARALDVRVSAAGFAPAVEVGIPVDGEPIRLVLTRGRTVRGVVRDAAGAALAGVRMTASATVRGVVVESAARTDGEGRYEIAGVPGARPGTLVRLVAEADGFAPQVRGMGLAPLTDVEDFVLVRGAVLTGVVRSASDGRPLADAEVVWWTTQAPLGNLTYAGRTVLRPFGGRIVARTRTDGEGRYRFERVPVEAGGARFDVPFRAGVKRLGGVGAYAAGSAAGGTAVALPLEDGATVETDVELPEAGTVVGRVVDGLGRPVVGARVYVGDLPPLFQGERGCVPDEDGPLGGAVRTGADGSFEHAAAAVPKAPETVARLFVSGEDHGLMPHLRTETTVTAGGRTDVGTLVLGPPALILVRGVVVDDAGAPVVGAAVAAGVGYAETTDANGRFEVAVAAPPPGAAPAAFPPGAKLSVFARGFADAKAPLPEAGSEARVVLVRGAPKAPPRAAPAPVGTKVTIIATDSAGRTLAASVATTFMGIDARPSPVPRVASGSEAGSGTAVARLRAGRWRVRAIARGYLPATADFEIADGESERTVAVVCVAAATLRGRVGTAAGKAPPRSQVVAEPLDAPGSDGPVRCVVAPNGDYRLDGLAAGRWRVGGRGEDGAPIGPTEELTIPEGPGTTTRDLRIH